MLDWFYLRLELSIFLKNFEKVFFYILIPFENIFPGIFSFEILIVSA